MPFSRPKGALWHHSDFLRLWAGQTVSSFGTLISGFAIPFIAVVTLDASAFQVALLGAAGMAPGFVLGLLAGVWVDRLRRRPILIATDLLRGAVLLSIPIAHFADRLTIGQLLVVALLTSAFGTCFDLAYRSYLPSLVQRDQLVEANSKLQATASISEVSGFALGGALVQLLSAAGAVIVDALSFLVSAFSIWRIQSPEPFLSASDSDENTGALREIREGIHYITTNALLRTSVFASGVFEFKRGIVGAVIFVFIGRTLDLPAALMGAIFTVGGISALGGAVLAGRYLNRHRFGRTLILAFAVSGLGTILLPIAGGPLLFAALWLEVTGNSSLLILRSPGVDTPG